MDKPITFYVLVLPSEKSDALGDARTTVLTEDEIKAMDVGYARLEVIPRGKGELLVRAPLLYHSITPGEDVAMSIDLVNEGTHRLDNIVVEVDLPLSWRKEVSPEVIQSLEIGQDKRMNLRFFPPDDIAEGKYDIRLRTTGMSNNEPISGEDKSVTVEVRAKANVFGTMIIVLLLLGVVGGMVFFGVRLSRR